MNEAESLRRIRALYGPILASAAARFGHRPEVLAGVMQRETEGGTSPCLDRHGPEGRGDGGHGHGLMQIDDRSFPEFCAGPDWKDPAKNIEMGAWVLGRKRAFLASRTLGFKLTNDNLERASIAAYNAGEGRVLKAIEQGRDPDSCTAHGDYAAAVLRYADLYLKLEA